MIAPFDWWLLIVGLAAGAGLAWLVLADLRRREDELDERERIDEAAWIAGTLDAEGRPLPVDAVEDVLALHRWYLREPPRVDVRRDSVAGYGEPSYARAADAPNDVATPDEAGARPD